MDKERISANLRRLRLEKGYTQERLASALGTSPQAVSRWECGTALPDILQLWDLARLYGITMEDLFREDARGYPNYAQRLLAVYEATGRTEDFLAAEQEFTQLLTGTPTADDLRAFGVLYHYMTKWASTRALAYLDDAMARADRGSAVWTSAAQQRIALLCDLGRASEEASRLERERQIQHDDETSWELCILANHLGGENQRALDLVQEALNRFPGKATFCLFAGDICRALKHYDEAFSHWEQALALDPSFLDARYSMGFCYEEQGMYAHALQIWTDLQKELLGRGMTQESLFPAQRVAFCRNQA